MELVRGGGAYLYSKGRVMVTTMVAVLCADCAGGVGADGLMELRGVAGMVGY